MRGSAYYSGGFRSSGGAFEQERKTYTWYPLETVVPRNLTRRYTWHGVLAYVLG